MRFSHATFFNVLILFFGRHQVTTRRRIVICACLNCVIPVIGTARFKSTANHVQRACKMQHGPELRAQECLGIIKNSTNIFILFWTVTWPNHAELGIGRDQLSSEKPRVLFLDL